MLDLIKQDEEKKRAHAEKLKTQAEGRSKRAHSRVPPGDVPLIDPPSGSNAEIVGTLVASGEKQELLVHGDSQADETMAHGEVDGGSLEEDQGGNARGLRLEDGKVGDSESSGTEEWGSDGSPKKKKKKSLKKKKNSRKRKGKGKCVTIDDSPSETGSSVDLEKSYSYLIEDDLAPSTLVDPAGIQIEPKGNKPSGRVRGGTKPGKSSPLLDRLLFAIDHEDLDAVKALQSELREAERVKSIETERLARDLKEARLRERESRKEEKRRRKLMKEKLKRKEAMSSLKKKLKKRKRTDPLSSSDSSSSSSSSEGEDDDSSSDSSSDSDSSCGRRRKTKPSRVSSSSSESSESSDSSDSSSDSDSSIRKKKGKSRKKKKLGFGMDSISGLDLPDLPDNWDRAYRKFKKYVPLSIFRRSYIAAYHSAVDDGTKKWKKGVDATISERDQEKQMTYGDFVMACDLEARYAEEIYGHEGYAEWISSHKAIVNHLMTKYKSWMVGLRYHLAVRAVIFRKRSRIIYKIKKNGKRGKKIERVVLPRGVAKLAEQQARWDCDTAGDMKFDGNPYAQGQPKFGYDFATGQPHVTHTPVASTSKLQSDGYQRDRGEGKKKKRGGNRGRTSSYGGYYPNQKVYNQQQPNQSGQDWVVQGQQHASKQAGGQKGAKGQKNGENGA